MRRFLLGIVIILTTFTLRSEAQLLMIRNFPPAFNASSAQNWGIAEGFGGQMFFGNNQGLLSYDGDEWNVSYVSNYTSVRSVQMSRDGKQLLAGATDEFGYFCPSRKSDQMVYYSLSNQLPKPIQTFGEIWHIVIAGHYTYFQGKNNVFVYRDNKFLADLPFSANVENIFPVDGRAIISTAEGLYSLNGTKMDLLPGFEPLQGKKVHGIGHFGKQWVVATERDGLFLYDGTVCRPMNDPLSQYLKQNYVYCVETKGQTMAFGTVRGGLAVANFETGERHFANVMTGLQNNTVLSMRYDHLGNLWLGLDVGISYVMLTSPYHSLFGLSNNIGTGYASLLNGQCLYLGTNQGLYALDYPIQMTPLPLRPKTVSGIIGQTWCLRRIGNVIFCGSNDGAFIINGMSATKIRGTIGTWNFIPLKGHPDAILACDYNGLYVLRREGGQWAMAWRLQGFNVSSGNFLQDADGSIWMSHWRNGVYRLQLSADLRRVTRYEYFHRGKELEIDDNNLITLINNKVYVSSVNGFFLYNPRTKGLDKQPWLNNIFNTYGVSLRVYQAPDGNLWAYKPGYLAYAQNLGKRWQVRVMPMHNVIDRLQMSLGHIGFVPGIQTLLNSSNGYYIVRNQMGIDTETGTIGVRVKRVSSFNEGDTTLYRYSPYEEQKELRVPHALNSIRFSFVMPEYRDENAVSYECKLEGQDPTWSMPRYASFKEYSHLGKGHYVFHVRATDNISKQTTETTFRFEVLPAWYETIWAYLIYITLIMGLLWMMVQWQKRRAEAELQKLKEGKERQLKEQRERFRREQEEKEHELTKLRAEQLETELKHKSGELADSTINLVRKNDILRTLDEKMQALTDSIMQNDSKALQKQAISRIRHEIKRNMEDDDNWERFQDNFNIVYDNYLGTLVAMFPTLKKNDLKLCAYLKMGLSSKEIASLLNTNLRSVETARYRLRKKLGLEGGANLTGFLQAVNRDADTDADTNTNADAEVDADTDAKQ